MRKASQLFWRGFVLFFFGTCLFFILNILQTRRHLVPSQIEDLMTKAFYSRWWLSIICGSSSALIGLIYPCLEQKLGDQHLRSQEWSRVLRCIAMFVGINEAYTKIDFPSNSHLTISLLVLSIGMWWYFDRTCMGFALGISIAVLATVISQMLVYHQVWTLRNFVSAELSKKALCSVFAKCTPLKKISANTFANQVCLSIFFLWYTEGEFLYIKSWLPFVVFSGGITIGNIGKQLAMSDFTDEENKAHTE